MRISVCRTFLPLAVTARVLILRSFECGRRTTRPPSSRRSVGSTTVDGLQRRRAASSFWEIACSGSSCTSAQAETGESPAAAEARFMRSSQPARDSTTSAQSSWAAER